MGAYEEALAQSESYFVAEVVDVAASFCVGCCALFLQVFRVAVEDLEDGRSGGLDCIAAMLGREDAPSNCWVREEWTERGRLHV